MLAIKVIKAVHMSNSFLKTTAMIIALTLVGRLLGFVRNVFLANTFGIGIELDAYLMAFTVPMLLFFAIPGAVNAVLLPVIKGMMGEDEAERRNALFHKTVGITSVVFIIITIAGIVWASQIVSVLAPGFSPDKQALTAELLKLMMPSALFIGIIAILTSVLNAHYEFFAPTLGTIINGLIVIISLYTLVPMLGIHGIAWGTMLGYFIYACYLIAPTRKKGYTFKVNFKIREDRDLRGMGERFVPVFIGIIISQLYMLVERFMASGLGDQKVTVLSFGLGLVDLPYAIFAGALAVPLFPLLAEFVKKQQMAKMKETLRNGMLYQYFFLLPAVLGFIILSNEIVGFFYHYSDTVTDEAIALTAWGMIFYSFSILGRAASDLLIRASYAIENTKTPVIINGVCIGLYVVLGFILIKPLDFAGLALAFSLSHTVNYALQTIFLKKQIGALYNKAFFLSLGKGVVATVVMSAVIWLLRDPTAGLGKLQVPILVVIGAVIYGIALLLLREALLQDIVRKVLNRLRSGGGTHGV